MKNNDDVITVLVPSASTENVSCERRRQVIFIFHNEKNIFPLKKRWSIYRRKVSGDSFGRKRSRFQNEKKMSTSSWRGCSIFNAEWKRTAQRPLHYTETLRPVHQVCPQTAPNPQLITQPKPPSVHQSINQSTPRTQCNCYTFLHTGKYITKHKLDFFFESFSSWLISWPKLIISKVLLWNPHAASLEL